MRPGEHNQGFRVENPGHTWVEAEAIRAADQAFAQSSCLHPQPPAPSVMLLDLADRPDLRDPARDSQQRIDIRTTETDHRPANALLTRPDAHITWGARVQRRR